MAWGAEFGGRSGKLFLTIFRLFAICGIGYWLYKSVKDNAHNILIVAISLIFAGAMGNIIDSVFYGVLFDAPYNATATLFSDQPYGKLFFGKVVEYNLFKWISLFHMTGLNPHIDHFLIGFIRYHRIWLPSSN